MHSDLREHQSHQENVGAAPRRGRQAAALLSVCLGFFVIQLDVTIVNVALLVHHFPDQKERARALGVWGGMGSVGVALGPVAGGALVAAVGWRSIFLVNVPICLLTAVLLRRFADESPTHP